jgi:streptogramin lyase/mono/diheme cytochrome c family protein
MRKACFLVLIALFAGVILSSMTTAQQAAPSSSLTPAEKSGRSLFQTRCAMCHVGGEATTEMPTATEPPRASTMGPVLSRVNTTDMAALRQTIKEGSARMPGYKYTFSDEQVDQVAAFMKTLDKPLTRLFAAPSYAFSTPGAEAGVLTGTIKSASGTPLEGVAVSAQLPGEPITTSVYTGADGRFFFPAMKSGTYNVWAQAIGLERAESTAALGARTVKVDFTMKETTDLIPQLSGYQIIAALPEDTVAHRRGKALFQKNCTYCHETSASLRDRFDQAGWEVIVGAMTQNFSRTARPLSPAMKELATYLTEMRGPGPSPMQPKVYRPKGEATLPVIYEYDVEYADGGYSTHNGSDWRYGHGSIAGGGGAIHDAVLDWDGHFWFTSNRSSANRTIGRVDGKTGKTTNFAVPIGGGRTAQSHGILLGPDGHVYFNSSPRIPYLDGDLGIVDTRAQKVETVKPPDGMTRVSGWLGYDAKGRIWTASGMMQPPTGALRFDPKTKTFTLFKSPTATMTYGITGDIDGNGWWAGVNEDIMLYSDENDQPHEIKLPSQPAAEYLRPGDFADGEVIPQVGIGGKQSPRRPVADLNSTAVWVPNFYGNTLLRIDSRTKALKYYPVPYPGMTPYEAAIDSQHNVWITFQNSDEVGRFNPETASWTMYSYPTKGMAQRQNHLLERDGILQLVSASGLSHRVGRMVVRSEKDVQALRARAQ